MKSKIYKKLTIENKILLSESALNYLSSHKITDLDHIINEYKKSTYPILTEDLVKQFLLKKEDTILSSAFYQIINYEYKIKNFAENYEYLKNKINLKIVPILHLKEQKEANIFGLFYSNFMNESILEDSFSEVKLDFVKCKSKIFLFDKMFLGFKGTLINKIFYVDEFFLPNLKSTFVKNDLLKQKDFSFLVFFDVKFSHKNVKILREIFIKNLPETVFFLGNYDRSDECVEFIKENTHILFFFVHTRDELPRKFQPICTEQNYKIMTNPCEIHFKNFKISFIVSEIFKNKTKGIFLQKNYQQSFISSYLSQYSYNPFVNLDFKIDTFPNLLFIGQNAFSGVFTCEDVNVVSVSSFEESFSYFKCDNLFNISLCEVDE